MIVPDDTFRSVLKFGGSCLKSSQDISTIAERISEIDHYPVVVVSAFFGVTDRLFDAIHEAKEHHSAFIVRRSRVIEVFRSYH